MIISLFFGHPAQHMGSYFLNKGLNTHSLQWKYGVLNNGLPGKSICNHILNLLLWLGLDYVKTHSEYKHYNRSKTGYWILHYFDSF